MIVGPATARKARTSGFITRWRLLVPGEEHGGPSFVSLTSLKRLRTTIASHLAPMHRLTLASLFTATLLAAVPLGAQGIPPGGPEAARERLRFIEGSFRAASGVAGDTTTTVWRFRPVLGGKYFELDAVFKVAFRVTIGFDSTSHRYRMSLLDAGTGAFDVYDGAFDATGALVLHNPHFWRVTFAPTPTGMTWRFEHSTDRGTTWEGAPASEMKRMRVLEHP
jgi:hypothetical protein